MAFCSTIRGGYKIQVSNAVLGLNAVTKQATFREGKKPGGQWLSFAHHERLSHLKQNGEDQYYFGAPAIAETRAPCASTTFHWPFSFTNTRLKR